MIEELARERHLLHSAAGDAWFARARFPQKEVNIRGIGESFAIFQTGKKRPLGSIDGHRALRECHPGAVYLHKAQTWVVEKLDLDRRNVWVNPIEPNYFTRIQTDKETEILEVLATRQVARFTAHIGRLKVTEHLLSYEKRRLPGQELLGQVDSGIAAPDLRNRGHVAGDPGRGEKRGLRRRTATSWAASTPWSTS